MKTIYYMNFPKGRRLYAECEREERLPIHTHLNFPSNHPEVEGYLWAWVTDTTEYIGKTPFEDHWVIDLTPQFNLSLEAFLEDQQSVGRFLWMRSDSSEPSSD